LDTSPANLRVAHELGAIGRAAASLHELAVWSEILVLAAPLDATLEHLAELSAGAAAGRATAIFDVASVKGPIARAADGLENFVGTHPIAGSERSGPSAARADLFADRVWTYDSAAAPAARERAERFIVAMGALAVPMESTEHDRIVALTSHLPQLLSTALGAHLAPALASERVGLLCGTGIASMLRLAGSSWPVWHPILSANAVPLAQEVRRLATILSEFATALEDGAPGSLEEAFERANAAAVRMRSNVAAPGDVGTVRTQSISADER
jgi:prephenate dehydrogenase